MVPSHIIRELMEMGEQSEEVPDGSIRGTTRVRVLGESRDDENDEFASSYFVDSNGNEYDPDSLAWRYLGLHIDCEAGKGDDEDRRMEEGYYYGSSSCKRVLLWAAYVNPQYQGSSLGEYQFYNIHKRHYDSSTCESRTHCIRLDCHEPDSTNFELVGVFKDTAGLPDWTELLFQHEGYCVWNDNATYAHMQVIRTEQLPTSCTPLYRFVDENGNSLYLDLKPELAGDIGIGIYIDDQCTQESSLVRFLDYIVAYYTNFQNYSEEKAVEAAASWKSTIQTWNTNMDTFKICQPCRSYTLNKEQPTSEYESENEHSSFNCFDDAGETNANQCYLFETGMVEPVDQNVLALASSTIFSITVDETAYGSGSFHSSSVLSLNPVIPVAVLGAFMISASVFLLMVVRYLISKRKQPVDSSVSERSYSRDLKALSSLSSWMTQESMKSQDDGCAAADGLADIGGVFVRCIDPAEDDDIRHSATAATSATNHARYSK